MTITKDKGRKTSFTTRIFYVILLMLMIIINGTSNKADAAGSDFKISNGVLTKYTGKSSKVIIPSTVKSIGDYAFEYCDTVKTVVIPNTVKKIGDLAFYDCIELTSITIPDSVTSIGDQVFVGCEKLKNIPSLGSIKNLGQGVFGDCVSLKSITIPMTVTEIGVMAFDGCQGLEKIIIPNSVKVISSYAFSGCTSLKDIVIPNSVEYLSNGVFLDCSNLESVTLSNSITSIEDSAFSGCYRLFEITIPESVKTIAEMAFRDCISLKRIRLPKSVKSVDKLAFSRRISVWSGNEVALEDFIIECETGTYAEKFAKREGFGLELIGKTPKEDGLPAQTPTSFRDIKRGSTYYAPVTKLARLGAIGGFSDGTFRPSDKITNQDFICILMRAMNEYQPRAKAGVDADAEIMKSAMGDGIFSTDDLSVEQYGNAITFQDMVMYSARAREIELLMEKNVIKVIENIEVAIPDYSTIQGTKYETYLKEMYSLGIVTDRGDKAPNLNGEVTRGKAISVIYCVLDPLYRDHITATEIKQMRPCVTLKWNDPDRLLPKAGDTWVAKNGKKTVLTSISWNDIEVPGYGQGIDLYTGLSIPYGTNKPLRDGGEGITWHDDSSYHYKDFIVAKDSKGILFAYFENQWDAIAAYEGKLSDEIKNPKNGQMVGHFTKYYSDLDMWGWVGPN